MQKVPQGSPNRQKLWWRQRISAQEHVDTTPGPQAALDETGVVLLCIAGQLDGIPVTFLIDSGATECFVSTRVVREHSMKICKRKKN